jgi:hypothetical protein
MERLRKQKTRSQIKTTMTEGTKMNTISSSSRKRKKCHRWGRKQHERRPIQLNTPKKWPAKCNCYIDADTSAVLSSAPMASSTQEDGSPVAWEDASGRCTYVLFSTKDTPYSLGLD